MYMHCRRHRKDACNNYSQYYMLLLLDMYNTLFKDVEGCKGLAVTNTTETKDGIVQAE